MNSYNTSLHKKRENNIIKIALPIFLCILFVYIIICIMLYFSQDSLIFFPQALSQEAISISSEMPYAVEDIELKMKDGITVRGWFVKNNTPAKSNLLIYFGGNAEEVSHLISHVRLFEQWSVVLINYRGYGGSEGKPEENTMFSDSLEIYDAFSEREDINKDGIVVMGRSIGTGVAAYLAENRKTAGVILVSPYDSLASVVQEKYPLFPAKLLLKHKFDTLSRAPSIKSPLLIITGSEDRTIPPWHSKKVADAWGGTVLLKEIVGENHNSLSTDEYWEMIQVFMTKQLQ